jgi:serine O-acetyltransferase
MKIETFRQLREVITSDALRYDGGVNLSSFFKLYFFTVGFRYSFWLRVCRYLAEKKIQKPLFFISYLYLRHMSYKSGIQIPYMTQIGRGFYIGHFGTIIVNGSAKIGNNVNISPCVIIGQTNRGQREGVPTVGNGVYIGPGAKIIGKVIIGNNVAIGAGSVVTKDVPDNACVVGVPAKIISYDGAVGYVMNKV